VTHLRIDIANPSDPKPDAPTHCPGCGDRLTVHGECPRTAPGPSTRPMPERGCYAYEIARRTG